MLGKKHQAQKYALIQFYSVQIKKTVSNVRDALRYGRTSEARQASYDIRDPRVVPPAPGFLRVTTDKLILTFNIIICWAPCQVPGHTPYLALPVLYPTHHCRPSSLFTRQMVPVLTNTIAFVVWSVTFSCYSLLSKNMGILSKQVKCIRGGFAYRK